MQQAQVNLLADMSAQPTTLMPGLVAATKSTDTVGSDGQRSPSPAAGASQPNGTQVTVTGTATDAGGGVVAGVEVVHRRRHRPGTRRPAPGPGPTPMSSTAPGSEQVQVRAVDDSANIGYSGSRAFAVACPCSVFGAAPAHRAHLAGRPAGDLDRRHVQRRAGHAVHPRLGRVRHRGALLQGHPGYSVPDVAEPWSITRQRLASATFTNESTWWSPGWESVSFLILGRGDGGYDVVVSSRICRGLRVRAGRTVSSAALQGTRFVWTEVGAVPAGVTATRARSAN